MRHWEGFHAQWASAIASALNDILPEEYFAEPQVHVGSRVEVDVASFNGTDGGAVAILPRTMPKLAPADLVLDAVFPDQLGVQVFETSSGPRLVAAVELVSPANKDRLETRQAFAAKCASYVQSGCGLIVVDVVTNRQSRPLDDLLTLIAPTSVSPAAGSLHAVSFRPLRDGRDLLEVRIRPLEVGQPLPELPLALNAGMWVMVGLESDL